MPVKTTYTHARANLAKLWNDVENTREPAILQRRGHEPMALLPAEELSSLEETAHLLRSPNNAVRLLSALIRSRRQETAPVDLERLEEELELTRSG
jgi:antitoxin YefM